MASNPIKVSINNSDAAIEHNKTIQIKYPEVLEQDQEMSFQWHIRQHYQDLVKQFEEYSTQELKRIVNKIIAEIQKNRGYFKPHHISLIDSLRDTIHSWMIDDILTWETFHKEQTRSISSISADSSPTEENDEEGDDAWRGCYMRGYNGDDSDKDNNDYDEGNEGDDLQTEDNSFKQWR